MSFVVFVSKRYSKPKQNLSFTSFMTFISVLSVAVGVMTLIIVIAVMNGFESDLRSRIIKNSPHIIVTKGDGTVMSEHYSIIKYLETIPGIKEASPFIVSQAIITTHKTAVGTIIKGIQNHEKLISDESTKQTLFHNPSSQNLPKIILSTNLMKSLDLTLGDSVYITSPKGIMSPLGHIPYMRKFKIAGFTEIGSSIQKAYISITEAQKLLKLKNSVTGIEAKTNESVTIDKVANTILSNMDSSMSVKTWKEMNINLFSAMKLEKIVMYIVLSLIVLVATFSITASLALSVFNKRFEIAILKTMGATNKNISKIFVLKGMTLGLIGTVIGTLTGIILTVIMSNYPVIRLPAEIYSVTALPIQLKTYDVVITVFSALVISFIATISPAIKASHGNLIQVFNSR